MVPLQGRMKEGFNLFSSDLDLSFPFALLDSSRRSQDLANLRSRVTVDSDTPSTLPISSTVNPPEERELYSLALTRVDLFQPSHGVVESDVIGFGVL